MEDLLEDINVYTEMEQDVNLDFWKDMTIICEDEISKLKKIEDSMGTVGGVEGGGAERRAVINPSVMSDVATIFKGKTVRNEVVVRKESKLV